jgi:hypothetical protein
MSKTWAFTGFLILQRVRELLAIRTAIGPKSRRVATFTIFCRGFIKARKGLRGPSAALIQGFAISLISRRRLLTSGTERDRSTTPVLRGCKVAGRSGQGRFPWVGSQGVAPAWYQALFSALIKWRSAGRVDRACSRFSTNASSSLACRYSTQGMSQGNPRLRSAGPAL